MGGTNDDSTYVSECAVDVSFKKKKITVFVNLHRISCTHSHDIRRLR